MAVRLNITPATPTPTDSTPSAADQRRAKWPRRKAAVLTIWKLRTKHEPARDGNQHKG